MFIKYLTILFHVSCCTLSIEQVVMSHYNSLDFSFENGFPKQYVSGSIHYFRVHPSDWRDRLKKLRWAGLHAVQTYVEWSSHEPLPGEFDFSGRLNLVRFVEVAGEEGLAVILRPGPYICSERDMGGLPFWLLSLEPRVRLRTSDPRFMKYVKRWYDVLLPLLKPLMFNNGGPIAMVQVENEYGGCDQCDFEYLTELADIFKSGLAPSPFLFSTDNGRTKHLKCAKIPAVYVTVDFGPEANITEEFKAQTLINGAGPWINSEYYTGWLDHWGEPHNKKRTEAVVSTLDAMLSIGASVNFYVFHGGTSFGFGAGSNIGERFQACLTSYDLDAPLNEAGDPAEKYYPIRNIMKKYFPVPSGPPPVANPKCAYGDFPVFLVSSVFEILPLLNNKTAKYPKTFEELFVPNGIVVYSTKVPALYPSPCEFSAYETHDRGYVYVDRKYQGLLTREEEIYTIPISASPNQEITVIVESQGRVSVGPYINDFKGLTTTPMIEGNSLENWTMTQIPLSNITVLKEVMNQGRYVPDKFGNWILSGLDVPHKESNMLFFEGIIFIPDDLSHPRDTFLKLDMFSKGYVWVNDFLLGRYWPIVGPQRTLFIPHGILQRGKNTILLLELEGTTTRKGEAIVSLIDKPLIDEPTPHR